MSGRTKKTLEAVKALAADGWKVRYVVCDQHPSNVSKKLGNDFKFEDNIEFVLGKQEPGYISEVIEACEKGKAPDVLVIEGYPLGPSQLRLLHEAGNRLKMAVLPTQQPATTHLR